MARHAVCQFLLLCNLQLQRHHFLIRRGIIETVDIVLTLLIKATSLRLYVGDELEVIKGLFAGLFEFSETDFFLDHVADQAVVWLDLLVYFVGLVTHLRLFSDLHDLQASLFCK